MRFWLTFLTRSDRAAIETLEQGMTPSTPVAHRWGGDEHRYLILAYSLKSTKRTIDCYLICPIFLVTRVVIEPSDNRVKRKKLSHNAFPSDPPLMKTTDNLWVRKLEVWYLYIRWSTDGVGVSTATFSSSGSPAKNRTCGTAIC